MRQPIQPKLHGTPICLGLDGKWVNLVRLRLPDGTEHDTDYMTAHIIASHLGFELEIKPQQEE